MEAILEGPTEEDNIRLQVLNFSVGGFFCLSSRPLRPMTRLGIRFLFPPYGEHASRAIEAVAVVVRCEAPAGEGTDHRMAACFTEMAPEARSHIQGYVDWYQIIHAGADKEAA
jgi:hypothetical protein